MAVKRNQLVWANLPYEIKLSILSYTLPLVATAEPGWNAIPCWLWPVHRSWPWSMEDFADWRRARSVSTEWNALAKQVLHSRAANLRISQASTRRSRPSLAEINTVLALQVDKFFPKGMAPPMLYRLEVVHDWYIIQKNTDPHRTCHILHATVVLQPSLRLGCIEWHASHVFGLGHEAPVCVHNSSLEPCIERLEKQIREQHHDIMQNWRPNKAYMLRDQPTRTQPPQGWEVADRLLTACCLPSKERRFSHDDTEYYISTQKGGKLMAEIVRILTFLDPYRRLSENEAVHLKKYQRSFGRRCMKEIVSAIGKRLNYGEGKMNDSTPRGACQAPWIIL